LLASGDIQLIELINQGASPTEEYQVSPLSFSSEWLVDNGLSQVFLMRMVNDAMSPTLKPGNLVLADASQKRIAGDGLYIIDMDGTLDIKRVQAMPGGILELSSDNPAYKSFTISPAQQQSLKVLGKAVWSGGSI
jgi:phage repressor protein C with HTH and peptisase S24 domain